MESETKPDFDFILVLDFEAQCSKDEKLKVQEIIEFPIIVVDVNSKKVMDNYFHYYVKPTQHPLLFNFCKELTGITQYQVDNGKTLTEVLELLDQFLLNNNLLNKNFIFVTCGDWDLKTCLRSETKHKKIEYKNYLKKWINLKKVFCDFIKEERRIDMVEMLKEFNIKLEGRHHSGIDDAKNLAKIVLHLLNNGQIFSKSFVNEHKK